MDRIWHLKCEPLMDPFVQRYHLDRPHSLWTVDDAVLTTLLLSRSFQALSLLFARRRHVAPTELARNCLSLGRHWHKLGSLANRALSRKGPECAHYGCKHVYHRSRRSPLWNSVFQIPLHPEPPSSIMPRCPSTILPCDTEACGSSPLPLPERGQGERPPPGWAPGHLVAPSTQNPFSGPQL